MNTEPCEDEKATIEGAHPESMLRGQEEEEEEEDCTVITVDVGQFGNVVGCSTQDVQAQVKADKQKQHPTDQGDRSDAAQCTVAHGIVKRNETSFSYAAAATCRMPDAGAQVVSKTRLFLSWSIM